MLPAMICCGRLATLLQAHLRRQDTLARLGGDEFGLLHRELSRAGRCAHHERAAGGLAHSPVRLGRPRVPPRRQHRRSDDFTPAPVSGAGTQRSRRRLLCGQGGGARPREVLPCCGRGAGAPGGRDELGVAHQRRARGGEVGSVRATRAPREAGQALLRGAHAPAGAGRAVDGTGNLHPGRRALRPDAARRSVGAERSGGAPGAHGRPRSASRSSTGSTFLL